MFWYNKTLVEFASPNITCPGKTNLMLDTVSSSKCLVFISSGEGTVCQEFTSYGFHL